MDENVFLESRDITGNIAMCHKHDCTTGCDRIFDLTDRDIEYFLKDDQLTYNWFNRESYTLERKVDDFSRCCSF
jgi:hypothetical protein